MTTPIDWSNDTAASTRVAVFHNVAAGVLSKVIGTNTTRRGPSQPRPPSPQSSPPPSPSPPLRLPRRPRRPLIETPLNAPRPKPIPSTPAQEFMVPMFSSAASMHSLPPFVLPSLAAATTPAPPSFVFPPPVLDSPSVAAALSFSSSSSSSLSSVSRSSLSSVPFFPPPFPPSTAPSSSAAASSSEPSSASELFAMSLSWNGSFVTASDAAAPSSAFAAAPPSAATSASSAATASAPPLAASVSVSSPASAALAASSVSPSAASVSAATSTRPSASALSRTSSRAPSTSAPSSSPAPPSTTHALSSYSPLLRASEALYEPLLASRRRKRRSSDAAGMEALSRSAARRRLDVGYEEQRGRPEQAQASVDEPTTIEAPESAGHPRLPNETWLHIFSYLKREDVLAVMQVDHHFFTLVSENVEFLPPLSSIERRRRGKVSWSFIASLAASRTLNERQVKRLFLYTADIVLDGSLENIMPTGLLSITQLSLFEANIPASALPALFSLLPNLVWADFYNCRAIDDRAIRALVLNCPHVRHLNLSCTNITAASIETVLRRCHRIETLFVAWCVDLRTNIGVDVPAGVTYAAATTLQHLDLSGCNLRKIDAVELLRACPRLVYLGLNDCTGLSGLLPALVQLHELQQLQISRSYGLKTDMPRAIGYLRNLTELHMFGFVDQIINQVRAKAPAQLTILESQQDMERVTSEGFETFV